MDMVCINGPIIVSIRDIGNQIKFQALANTPGMMAERTREIGMIIICTGREFISGRMAENTKGTTSMIKKTAMESTLTPMAAHTKDNGKMENSTEKVHLSRLKEKKEREFGTKAKEPSGLMTKKKRNKNNKWNKSSDMSTNFCDFRNITIL